MRIARLGTSRGPLYVRSDEEGRWIEIEDPYAAFSLGRAPHEVREAPVGRLLPPAQPLALVGMAQNRPAHPSPVQAWLKSPRTVVASGVAVALRRDAGATIAEGEIAVVIGRDTTGLTEASAHEYVLGVTAVNDLSSPERNQSDPRNFESKSGDGYTPLGPWIETEAGIDDVQLTLSVNGRVIACTNCAALPVSIRACMVYVTAWTRLGPGDVIMTGAPHSNAPIAAGDEVEVTVAGARLLTPTM